MDIPMLLEIPSAIVPDDPAAADAGGTVTYAQLCARVNAVSSALLEAGLPDVRMLLQVHDELVFELREGDVERAMPVIERVMAGAAAPSVVLDVPLAVEIGTGRSWGAAH